MTKKTRVTIEKLLRRVVSLSIAGSGDHLREVARHFGTADPLSSITSLLTAHDQIVSSTRSSQPFLSGSLCKSQEATHLFPSQALHLSRPSDRMKKSTNIEHHTGPHQWWEI